MVKTPTFDPAAYAQRLIEKGLDPDAARDVAARLVESGYVDRNPSKGLNKAHAGSEHETPPAKKSEGKAPKDPQKPLTRQNLKLIEAGTSIGESLPSGDQMTFMHTIMCQVGLPRSAITALEFERISGAIGLYVRAGKLWDGDKFVQQPVPYGTMPRLVMAYLNTQALRQRSPEIQVGNSASEFMRQLGKEPHGGRNGSYTAFRKQVMALSACHMTIGYSTGQLAYTYDGKPIKQFEAWLTRPDSQQRSLWPGVVSFSEEYFRTLSEHAVPLDLRAMQALKGSALAMDTYAMLAERLHRIDGRPVILHWKSLRAQFGQEYRDDKSFKRRFLESLRMVQVVYPKAKVTQVRGGLMLKPSPPPVPYKTD